MQSSDLSASTETAPIQPIASSETVYQHGLLYTLPEECLTHVTSFVGVEDLLQLAQVSCMLNALINMDNTWHRAFLCHFLGINPSEAIEHVTALALRRTDESSWRNEYISRVRSTRRWELSRASLITHAPLQSTSISRAHLMSENALIACSLQYGVVSRSVPLTGTIARGFLDASGTGTGAGNPNTAFTPNITACALTSDGGTARIVWGTGSGDVMVVVAKQAMERIGRAGAKHSKCTPHDAHLTPVTELVWDGDMFFSLSTVSLKYWDSRTVRCLWTSPWLEDTVLNEYVKVTASNGVVAAAMGNGDVVIWTNLTTSPLFTTVPNPVEGEEQCSPLTLHLDTSTSTLLVAYAGHPFFYRVRFGTTAEPEVTQFGEDGAIGSIVTLYPVFASKGHGNGFVLVGDQLGCLSVYDLAGDGTTVVRRFEAHNDGAVTAIAWNALTVVTGSAGGNIAVWDALTFSRLRTFVGKPARQWGVISPPDQISQILLEKEFMVAVAGARAMSWKAGPVAAKGKLKMPNKSPSKARTVKSGNAKFHQQMELKQSLADLKAEQAAMKRSPRRPAPAQEQRSKLQSLGLDESEALEYLLMLSRDEEEEKRNASMMFEGNFGEWKSSPPSRTYSPRVSPSRSNQKVQVSPRYVEEPMSVGSTPPSYVEPMMLSPEDPGHFPSMSRGKGKTRTKSPTPSPPSSQASQWGKKLSPTLSASGRSPRNGMGVSPPLEMDEGLRMAIELSLIEARAQGLSV